MYDFQGNNFCYHGSTRGLCKVLGSLTYWRFGWEYLAVGLRSVPFGRGSARGWARFWGASGLTQPKGSCSSHLADLMLFDWSRLLFACSRGCPSIDKLTVLHQVSGLQGCQQCKTHPSFYGGVYVSTSYLYQNCRIFVMVCNKPTFGFMYQCNASIKIVMHSFWWLAINQLLLSYVHGGS